MARGFNMIVWGGVFMLSASQLSLAREKVETSGLAPHLQLSETVCDLGAIARNEKITHTITLKNTGSAPLAIKCIYTSCGCTTAKAKRTHLRPGQSTDLTIVINTSPLVTEPTREVYIQTNDPTQPDAVFTASLQVVNDSGSRNLHSSN
jgi:hypothetical protein